MTPPRQAGRPHPGRAGPRRGPAPLAPALLAAVALGLAAPAALAAPLAAPFPARGALTSAFPARGALTSDHWQEEQGVPGLVTAILQSPDGWLWVGTRRGLVRFDGLKFLRVALTDGAPELNVRALLADADGTVWVASDGGLARLSGGRTTRLAAGDAPVHALLRDRDGRLWAGTGLGLARVVGDRLELVGDPGPAVRALAEDAAGRLLAGTEEGLFTLRDGRLARAGPAEGGSRLRVAALHADRGGRTWVGTNDGLRRADPAAVAAHLPPVAGLASSTISALAEDGEGRLWVATIAGGVQRLSEDGRSAEPREERLSSRHVQALLADEEGHLWTGSNGGLERLRPRLVLPLTRQDGLSGEVIWSVYADPLDGALWLGLDGGGLDRLAGGRITPVAPRWGLSGASVTATLRDRDGSLWLSLRAAGLVRVRGQRVEPVLGADGAPYEWVRGLFQATDGGVLVGTPTGLERHLGGRVTRPAPSMTWPVRVIAEDPRGDAWVGGSGLYRLRGPGLALDTPAPLEDVHDVTAILPDGDDLWIASYSAGLLLWHEGQLASISALDPRFAGRGVALLPDDAGGLWLALEGALLMAHRDELVALAEGRGREVRALVFDERDGLPSTEFTTAGQTSAARTPDGRLWFGTVRGLVGVDPDLVHLMAPPAAPVVEQVFVAGVEVAPEGGAVRLTHGDAALELHFTSPTLLSPHRLQFRHRLLGQDVDWRAGAPSRIALYRALREGDYRFELEASRDGGQWVAAAAPIRIEVRPGPLDRTWVRALLGLVALAALLGAVTAVVRLRGRQLRARAQELSRLVEERTRELAAARDELEARVEERTAQLQRELLERERLERQLAESQKLDSIGRLAGGVAHDLNNLLTVVLGCAATAQDAPGTPPEVREDLQEIQKAGDRAAALTRQLLAFARRQILASRRLDLNEVVQGVGTMLRRIIGAHVELVSAPAAEPCPVLADPGQVEQVLVNLAVNARDAMPGGGTLRLETAALHAEADLGGARPGVAAGDWIRLTVRDTGAGLSEEARRHLFEPFFTTKEKGKGTGLGLATCYGIVTQMGGHIWLESQPGHGTAVVILLPRAAGKVEPLEVAVEPAPAGGGERVLVAEDEPQVRALAARALSDRGYRVRTAGDGEEALRLLEAEGGEVDLLLTDVVMPRMGGVELAAKLGALRPGLPVLFMSGYMDRTAEAQGALPADATILLKPFTPTALAARVREALDRRPRP